MMIFIIIDRPLFLFWRFEPLQHMHRSPCLLLIWNQATVQTYEHPGSNDFETKPQHCLSDIGRMQTKVRARDKGTTQSGK